MMAQDDTRDDLDRNEPDAGEDVRGIRDDEEFEGDDEAEAIEDEEHYDADERLTAEIGSEGGSPGETVRARRESRRGPARGSEATTTWSPGSPATETVERVGEENQPKKRTP